MYDILERNHSDEAFEKSFSSVLFVFYHSISRKYILAFATDLDEAVMGIRKVLRFTCMIHFVLPCILLRARMELKTTNRISQYIPLKYYYRDIPQKCSLPDSLLG